MSVLVSAGWTDPAEAGAEWGAKWGHSFQEVGVGAEAFGWEGDRAPPVEIRHE